MPMTKAKKKRLHAIGDLITDNRPIGSQAELVELLAEMGIHATQSSISRDLAELGVRRVKGRYVLGPWRPVGAGDFEGIVGFLEQAQRAGPHMAILVTLPNAAKMVAEAIQDAAWPEVAGIISGDDTIFVATSSEEDQQALFNRLREYLRRQT